MAKELFQRLKAQPHNYLAHEYFNRDWTTFYFADVAKEMSDGKLTFLSSANPLDLVDVINLTPSQRELLDQFPELETRETVKDFILN